MQQQIRASEALSMRSAVLFAMSEFLLCCRLEVVLRKPLIRNREDWSSSLTSTIRQTFLSEQPRNRVTFGRTFNDGFLNTLNTDIRLATEVSFTIKQKMLWGRTCRLHLSRHKREKERQGKGAPSVPICQLC